MGEVKIDIGKEGGELTVIKKPCGCKIILKGAETLDTECPLHAAAPEMLAILKAIRQDSMVSYSAWVAELDDLIRRANKEG